MCHLLQVSRSGFYSWVGSHAKPSKTKGKEEILREVQKIHEENYQSYGSRRMSEELRERGFEVGRDKARTLMKEAQVVVRRKKKFVVTTDSSHSLPFADNILDQDFSTDKKNEKWVGDITYLETKEGWNYLAVVLDLFSRRIVGWELLDHMRSELVTSAFQSALEDRKPGKGLLFHSDRGSQYAGSQFQELLQKNKVTVSMSGKGNCYDNAVCERFFRSLKHECTEYKKYRDHSELKKDVKKYIENFYNTRRQHSALGNQSPIQFEVQSYLKAA